MRASDAVGIVLCGVASVSAATPPPRSAAHVIDRSPFAITVVGPWAEEVAGDGDRWVYTRADGKASLTVSGLADPQRRSGKALDELVRGLVDMRRQVELEVSRGATRLEPVVVAQQNGAVVARYMASEPKARREVAVVVMGRPGVVLSFYLEALDLPRPRLEEIARPMFNSIILK